jgi:hypothetical protein
VIALLLACAPVVAAGQAVTRKPPAPRAIQPDSARNRSALPPVVLLEKPVRVVARPLELEHDGGPFVFRLSVEHGEQRFDLETRLVLGAGDRLPEAVAALRRTTGWKDGYLFVRTECGGGTRWKCATESVFMLRAGRLVALGSLLAGEERELATSWRGGAFHDIDADFEGYGLTKQVGAPRFDVLLHEREGRLVADTDSTWILNATQFADYESVAKANKQPEVTGYRQSWVFAYSPRLCNAVLAKYCGRAATLDSTLMEARAVLPAEILKSFDELLAKVETGALPRTSRLPPSPAR